jgi:hypothetical protein
VAVVVMVGAQRAGWAAVTLLWLRVGACMLDSRRVLGEQRETRRAQRKRDDSNEPALGQIRLYDGESEVEDVPIVGIKVRVVAAAREARARHVVAAMSACFDVPPASTRWRRLLQWESGMAARWSLALTFRQALDHLSIDTPHRPRSACRRCVQSLMLVSPKLRITLLHCAPTSPLAVSHSRLILSHIRTMTTKPSLKAAEDFLSFVNASPTRMSRAIFIPIDTNYT